MKEFDYSQMSYDELIDAIIEIQKELYYKRGTTTHCFNIWNNGREKLILIDRFKKVLIKEDI